MNLVTWDLFVPKTFNLLSIGQRGVGDSLAGSYAELHSNSQDNPQQLWFDRQDTAGKH